MTLPRTALLIACLTALPVAAAAQALPARPEAVVVRGRVAASASRWDASKILYTYVLSLIHISEPTRPY